MAHDELLLKCWFPPHYLGFACSMLGKRVPMLSSQMVVWWWFTSVTSKKTPNQQIKGIEQPWGSIHANLPPMKIPFFCPGFQGVFSTREVWNSRNQLMCLETLRLKSMTYLTIQFPPHSLTPSSQKGKYSYNHHFSGFLLLNFRGL